MCAALFGLIAVCSTIALPSARLRTAPATSHCRSHAGRSRKKLTYPFGRSLDSREALDSPERADNLLRDDARRLAQPASQLEGERNREIAKRSARRRFHRNGRQDRVVRRHLVQPADGLGHSSADQCVSGKNHESASVLRRGCPVVIRSCGVCGIRSLNSLARS